MKSLKLSMLGNKGTLNITPFRKRNFIVSLINDAIWDLPAPVNLSIWWRFGSIIGVILGVQIVTGFILSCHYTAHVDIAFDSVVHIMRDVNSGWVLRGFHANGASVFFICIYVHIGRGFYYSSYQYVGVWVSGVALYLLLIAEAFIGYVLPWGQISYWGATVITSLVTVIPYVGQDLLYWVWGGYTVCNNTLMRFYSVHFILPFAIIGIIVMHLYFLHKTGSNNPLGVDRDCMCVRFHPYYTVKDLLGFASLGFVICIIVFYYPDSLGDVNNWIPADPMKTPLTIKPEWYFLWLYTVLRSIPNKVGGVVAIFGAIVIWLFLPILHRGMFRGLAFYPHRQFLFWGLIGVWCGLRVCGIYPVAYPIEQAGQILTLRYFLLMIGIPLTQGWWDWLIS